MLRGDVVGFAGVGRQVVKFNRRLGIFEKVSPNRLPVALQHSGFSSPLVEFPVEVGMNDLRGGIAQQGGGKGNAVRESRRRGSSQRRKGGQHILKSGNQAAVNPRGKLFRPASDQRNAKAAFVKVSFHSFERAIGVKERHLVSAFLVRAVVAAEEDGRLLVNAQGFEQGEEFTDVVVHDLDHAGESFFGKRPILPFEGAEVGNAHSVAADARFPSPFVVGVRQVGRVEEKEGAAAIFSNKGQGLVKDQPRRIVDGDFRNAAAFPRGAFFGFPFGVEPISKRDFPSVFDQKLRIEVVSVEHAHVAIKLVKAVLVGIVPRRRIADTPFAKTTGFIASLPQKSGDGKVLCSQQAGAVAANAGVASVKASHQDASRGSAYGGAGVVARKANAFGGHSVKMRSFQHGLAVASEVAVAEVIRQNVDKVGRTLLCLPYPSQDRRPSEPKQRENKKAIEESKVFHKQTENVPLASLILQRRSISLFYFQNEVSVPPPLFPSLFWLKG